MRLWPKGLNRQILTFTLTIVLGASVTIGLIALFMFYQYSKEQILLSNVQMAQNISDEIDMLMSRALVTGQSISKHPGISKFGSTESQDELNRLFYVANVFDGISLTDSTGKIVAFAPENPGIIGTNLSKRDWFKNAFISGKQYISEPYKAFTGNNVVVISTPVKDSAGKIIGVIGGSINLMKSTKFSTIISNSSQLPSIRIQVISSQGKLIYHPDKGLIMKDVAMNSVISEVLKGKSGSASVEIDNRSYLTGYFSNKTTGWGVVVEYPTETALQSANHLRNVILSAMLFICLFVFLIVFVETRVITKPLERLMEGVKKVGEGDYDFNVNISSENEIGVLAKSFNLMVERIKDMREDILQKKTELEKVNIDLQVMAITDGLTKLYNHRYFQDCLNNALRIADEEHYPVTLMILDLDHFKYYNDLFGHQSGDKLLEELAQLLIRELGPNDMVARYGGEEFTIILYGCDSTEGIKVAEKIRRAVESFPFQGRDQQPEGKITVSIGVASYPENASNKEELIRLADEALYKAKCCSRNKVELYFSVLDELKKDLDHSEVELINSIKMLIRIINAKDKYTYGHSERVGRYAVWIAEKMGLPEDEIKTIKMGSFLHDVGKIEISRSILMKRGPLNDEEFDVIKKHPSWGAGIIKAVEPLSGTIPLIKFHHERYDGSGYPKGLKGKQIPFHARILAVADSFDAMTSNRPYRKRKTGQEAIQELKRCSGIQFDPEVVDAFISVYQEQEQDVC